MPSEFAENHTRDTTREMVQNLVASRFALAGLTGRDDFELDWMPERGDPSTDDRPSIFTAVQEQLGLKLEPAKVPIVAVVIDRVERPSEN